MKRIELLKMIGACHEGVEFCRKYRSLRSAWLACERGDWMLWYASRVCGDDRRQLVLAACACARLALKHVPEGEDRPLKAIETAEAWCRSKASLEDVETAAYAASAAAYAAAYAAYAANAAYAAANAAAAYAAHAAHTANAAAYAAYAAAGARKHVLKRCADIVRKLFPVPPRAKKGGAS